LYVVILGTNVSSLFSATPIRVFLHSMYDDARAGMSGRLANSVGGNCGMPSQRRGQLTPS
jgi:hypothetical protein